MFSSGGNTGEQLASGIRAYSRDETQSYALKQARTQFGNNAGTVSVDGTKDIW